MKQKGFLEVYDLTLKTIGPLFIGDGRTILKKCYLYDSRSGSVSIFDEEKLFALLAQRNLIDQYEQFMLGRMNNLYRFLTQDCHLQERDWKPALRYTLKVGAALDEEHSLKDIHCFVRNAAGQVYLPGSSVKGALRTVLLHHMIRQEGEHDQLEPSRRERFGSIPESRYLHTLRLVKNRPDDMVNSLMRGLQVSDSLPVPDSQMILASKMDCRPDGSLSKPNVCRESIRPDTEIHLKLTLDQSVLQGTVTRESLTAAIDAFDEYYWDTYLRHFEEPARTAEVYYENCLFLGGGSGFFSKSLVYPYLGEKRGLKLTAEMMTQMFRKHYHDRDEAQGISPHTVKYTEYGSKLYPMGMCGVEIQ